MTDQPGTDSRHPEPHEISMGLPLGVGAAMIEMTAGLMADPAGLAGAQMSLWRDHMDLWGNTAWRMMGSDPEPVAVPDQDDTRFRDPAWSDNVLFESYCQKLCMG